MRNTFIGLGKLNMPVAFPTGGNSAVGGPLGDVAELGSNYLYFLNLPAIPVGSLPNGASYTFNLVSSNSPTFASILQTVQIGQQVGAGGVGAAAAVLAVMPAAITQGQYVTLQVVASSTAVPPAAPNNVATMQVAAW
jgi:hypothetical protein